MGAFVAGGGAFIGLDGIVGYVQGRLGGGEAQSSALAIFGGVSIDLFSDGVIIGTGDGVEPGARAVLALGQMPADVPERFAAVATSQGRYPAQASSSDVSRVRHTDPARCRAGVPGAEASPRRSSRCPCSR